MIDHKFKDYDVIKGLPSRYTNLEFGVFLAVISQILSRGVSTLLVVGFNIKFYCIYSFHYQLTLVISPVHAMQT